MKISIIIPAFNEEKTISELIRRVKKVNLGMKIIKEIIVVDDASTDKTYKKVQRIRGIRLLHHKINKGKGAAIKTALSSARGDVILIQDADLEYDPNDYSRLVQPIVEGSTSVVYGTRLKSYPLRLTGRRRTPLISHYLGNKLLTFVTNLLYGNGLTDMETCYKVFSRKALKGIELKASRFDFEPEITAKIMKRGYKIKEIPIKVNPRGYDEGKKISWKDGFIAVWTLIKYRFVE